MKIRILTPFLDGRDRYEQDDQRTVSDADGARFCAAGWAQDITGPTPTGEPATGEASLEIQDVTQSSEVTYG